MATPKRQRTLPRGTRAGVVARSKAKYGRMPSKAAVDRTVQGIIDRRDAAAKLAPPLDLRRGAPDDGRGIPTEGAWDDTTKMFRLPDGSPVPRPGDPRMTTQTMPAPQRSIAAPTYKNLPKPPKALKQVAKKRTKVGG